MLNSQRQPFGLCSGVALGHSLKLEWDVIDGYELSVR